MASPDNPRGDLRKAPRSGDVVAANRRPAPRPVDEGPSEADIEQFGGRDTQTCPACSKEIFGDSSSCYHCGHQLLEGDPHRRPWPVVLIALVLIAVFAAGIILTLRR